MPEHSRNVLLHNANTLRLPCEAAALLPFDSTETLQTALKWVREEGLEPLVLGEGSNVVLPGKLERAVLRCCDTSITTLGQDRAAVILRVGAGRNWHSLVESCLDAGHYGLENLALIPGTVGAAPVQNIGAYGVELASFVECVHGVHLDSRQAETLSADACEFAYRDSIFKGELRDRFVTTHVDLRLLLQPNVERSYPALSQRLEHNVGDATPRAVFEAVVALRRERLPDPTREPNAGSFFKNPILPRAQVAKMRDAFPGLPVYPVDDATEKVSAAWLIDYCGFKGAERGPVRVSANHALVLINDGGAQQALLSLADEITETVKARFGCELEIEPRVYC